jgi:prenyltransferase beta subunit
MNRKKAVSIFVALSIVFLVVAIQPASANPGTRLDSIILLLSENYDEDEGVYSLYEKEAPRVEPSYGAAVALDILGYYDARPPTYDLVKLTNFTRKIQWESGQESGERYGGFARFIAGFVDIEGSYKAVRIWEITRQHMDIPKMDEIEINKTAALVYVNKTLRKSGGFGYDFESPANLLDTYRALYIMNSMLKLIAREAEPDEEIVDTWEKWLPNETATVEYIRSCFDEKGFKLSPESNVIGVTPTAAGLLALEILGRTNEIPEIYNQLDEIEQWILDRQKFESPTSDFDGGFEEGAYTNDTNLRSTYYAIVALNFTNSIDFINYSAAARFVLNCQKEGGWNPTPGIGTGDLPLIAEAVMCLDLLDMTSLLYEEDPNNPALVIIDWRGYFIIGFIIVAAVIGYLSMRIE